MHGADGARADLGGPREGAARARRPVVGVGRLRLADQRRRPRGGRGAAGDVRRDGGAARRRALRARGVRRLGAAVRRAPTRSCASRQIVLFVLASRDDPALRQLGRSGSRSSTAIGVGLLVVGLVRRRRRCRARCGRSRSRSTWAARTSSAPRAGSSSPSHFAERHGLIVIIALGESIVAIGVGAEAGVDAGVVGGGGARRSRVAAALWWLYFDVVALVAERRLDNAAPGREQQRDRARLLLLPALPDGRRDRAARARAEEDARARRRAARARAGATALLGGTALYLLAHVAFRWRNVHRFSIAARWSRRVLRRADPARDRDRRARDARRSRRRCWSR